MKNSEFASADLYDFRRDFRALARPGRRRYLEAGDRLAGDDIDAELRAEDAKNYLSRLWWAIAWETQGKPWDADDAAEIAAEVEAAAIGDAEVYAADLEMERRAIAEYAVVDKDAELETLRRIAADPNYLRLFGGGDGYARQMVVEALGLYKMADQEGWRDEAIEEFLPIARAARGGKDDDPSMDLRIDRLAQTLVRKFVDAKIAAAAEAEAEDEVEAELTAKPEAPPKAASSHPLDGVTLGKGVDWTQPGGLLSDMVDWIVATNEAPIGHSPLRRRSQLSRRSLDGRSSTLRPAARSIPTS